MLPAIALLTFALLAFLTFVTLQHGGTLFKLAKGNQEMSVTIEELKSDATSVVSVVTDLKNQVATLNQTVADQSAQIAKLKAEAGATPEDLDAVDAILKPFVPAPPAPAPAS